MPGTVSGTGDRMEERERGAIRKIKQGGGKSVGRRALEGAWLGTAALRCHLNLGHNGVRQVKAEYGV